MKLKLATTCLIFSALLAPVLTNAEDKDSDRTHPMTFVKDSVITTKVKANLLDEKMNSLVHIRVDTGSKGEVVLSGNVRSQEDANKAIAIAQATGGVTSVTSKLTIRKDD